MFHFHNSFSGHWLSELRLLDLILSQQIATCHSRRTGDRGKEKDGAVAEKGHIASLEMLWDRGMYWGGVTKEPGRRSFCFPHIEKR